MREKNFLSSWLRQDQKVNERAGEEEENERKRGGKEKGWRERRERDGEKKVCQLYLAEAFDIFSQREDLESCGGVSWSDVLDNPDVLSDCESESRAVVSAVLVVSDVLVSLSSVVTECFYDVPLGPEWEFVEPRSLFFLEGASVHRDGFSGNHERWWSPVLKHLRLPEEESSRPRRSKARIRRMRSLQWQAEMEVQGSSWSVRERKAIAKKEDYLNKHDSVKVEVEELELMMSPEDSEVHLRKILMNASRRSSNIFEILSTKERKKEGSTLLQAKCDWSNARDRGKR